MAKSLSTFAEALQKAHVRKHTRVVKSLRKGTKLKGRPGLQLKEVSTKDGRSVRRWVKIGRRDEQHPGTPVPPAADRGEQYKRLGTKAPAFKAWFGDWEDSKAGASKVVNKNGEPQETYEIPGTGSVVKDADGKPLVVYHGTSQGRFSAFDKDKLDIQALYGPGMYFTEDQSVAQEYVEKDSETGKAPHVISAFLNIRNPFDLDQDLSRDQIAALADVIEELIAETQEAGETKAGSEWFASSDEDPAGVLREVADAEEILLQPLQDWLKDLSDGFVLCPTYDQPSSQCAEIVQRMGYDGMTHIGGHMLGDGKFHRVWIAFEPNQIKAVDNQGTFSPETDDIYKSFVRPYAQNRRAVRIYTTKTSPMSLFKGIGQDKPTDPNEDSILKALRKAVGEQKVKVRTRVRHTKTGTVIQPAHTETRKKAEPKASVKWVKGEDPFDGSPRYSIEGRNPGSSYERVTAVIVQEKEYNEFTFRKEPRYYGSVYDNKAEYAIDVGPFRAVKDAKVATEQAFHRMMADIAREEAQKQAEAQRANVNQVPPDQEIPDKPTPLRLVSENANYTIELEPSDGGASFTARMISSYGEEKASQTFPADQWSDILEQQFGAGWSIQDLKKAVQKVNVRTKVRKTESGPVIQPAHQETRKKAAPKLTPPKRPLKPEQKRAREEALGLPADKRKWTRKQFAEWLRVTAPDNDVTRACIANALDPNKPAPEYGLTYDRFQQMQSEEQGRQAKRQERDQAAAEGRHVWEHSGQVYYGPEPKGVVGTGLRPAIAMFEVKGDRVFMVADETTLQNRYKQALAIMRETGRTPKLQGILVTLDETKAEKEWQQRAQAFASQNAEDKDDAEGLLTPEARRAYEARAVKEKPAHRLKKALQWLLRKATEETQDVKVRTRVLHKKTGLVVQPAHTEKRKKAAPKPEREKSVQATEDATAKPGPKQRTNRRTGKGAPTSRTARGIITSRADLLPPVDLTACPQAIQTNLSEDQVEGVARAVVALDKQGGFIMADGTGVGKTRQILALARIYQERGHPVLIVAPSEVIKQDWKTGAYYGSYQEDGAAVGVTPQLIDGSKDRLKKGQVGITTYHHQKRVLPEDLPPGTVVLFDEAHALKNSTGGQPSGTAKWGIELANAAHSVVYATATPMDKAIHLPYLFRAGVFEGKTMEAALQELGLEYKHRRKKFVGGKWVDPSGWVIKKGLSNREVVRRIEQLFDRVTAAGCMLKREVSLEGLNVQLHGITAPPEARELMRSIESRYLRYNEETGETTIDPLSQARMMQDQRRHLEPFKISAAVAMIKDELAKGRHVVVFVARVNPSESADVNKDVNGDIISKTVFAQTEGTAVALRDALRAEGIEDVIEMHGQATKTSSEKKKAQDRFQAGDGRVLITTVESGGTGINLDDRMGDAPRTLICLTPPFTAPGVAQMVGRVLRRTTVSDVDVKFIFTGEEVDKWNARIANDKLAMLGASVKGDIASRIQLDEGMIDWITDEDAPYQFYNPNVIVIQQGRDYAEDEKPEPEQPREKKQAEPSKEPPAHPATPAQPVSGSGSGIPVEHRIFITKKGKAKPVFAFKLPGRMDKETYAEFSAAYGWQDSATGMYMVADKPENEALVARITGTQPRRTLKKGLCGGLRVRITKGFMRTHMSGGSRSHHHRLRKERP